MLLSNGLPAKTSTVIPGGFIYFPQAAIFYILFAKLPFLFSEILWRFLSLAVFAYAIYRLFAIESQNKLWIFFPLISIVSLCIGFDTARNGQFNIVIVSCMLLTVIALNKNQWWHIAFYLVIAFALKPTMIVMLLLVTALYRPLWLKVSLLLIIAALIPFLTQSFHYVINQYVAMFHMLHDAAQLGMNQTKWSTLLVWLDNSAIYSQITHKKAFVFCLQLLYLCSLYF